MVIGVLIIVKPTLKVSYVDGGEFANYCWPLSGTLCGECLYPGLHPGLFKFAPFRDRVTLPF